MWAGELYLFCKGADSSIFPRVVSGKVDEVRARVEHNAVVRAHTHTHTRYNRFIITFMIVQHSAIEVHITNVNCNYKRLD